MNVWFPPFKLKSKTFLKEFIGMKTSETSETFENSRKAKFNLHIGRAHTLRGKREAAAQIPLWESQVSRFPK